MKKLFTILSAFTLSLVIFSCGEKKSTENVNAPTGMVALDLSKFGKQFSVFVPDTTAAKLEIVEQSWGALEIKVGKGFHMSISEDPGDMELQKSDIKANDVNIFKSFVIDEPLTIMWESEITNPEYHFYSIQKVGNNSYVFQDVVSAATGPLGKEDVRKMVESSKKIIAKDKPEA